MILEMDHYFYNITMFVDGFSMLLNSFLIFIICTNLSPNIGSYKYLMIISALFDIAYSSVSMLTMPAVHIHGNAFITFATRFPHADVNLRRLLTALGSSMFSQSLCILSLHFVYRYILIARLKWLVIFKKFKYLFIIFVGYILIAFNFGFACYYLMGPSRLKNNIFRDDLLAFYNRTAEDTPYIGSVYYAVTSNGSHCISWMDVFGIIDISCVIFIALIVISTFGYKTGLELTRKHTVYNCKILAVQQQLFRALLMQTLLPLFFTFLPALAVILSTFLELPLNLNGHRIWTFLSLFPATGPFMILYYVRSYRHATSRILLKWTKPLGGFRTIWIRSYQMTITSSLQLSKPNNTMQSTVNSGNRVQ